MRYLSHMRIIVRSFIALFVATASFAYGSLPQMTVVVSDSSGRAAYKGATDANGTFSTSALKPGNYVVQFNSRKSADVKGKNYAVVVSAGKKQVTADSVEGDKFAAGGVAVRIEVGGSLSISGQVVDAATVKVDKNGKTMVWIPKKLGSNLPAHWAPAHSAEALHPGSTESAVDHL